MLPYKKWYQGLVSHTVTPNVWFALIEFLILDIFNVSMLCPDLLLEEVVLKDQDLDGKSVANHDLDDFDRSPMDELLVCDDNKLVILFSIMLSTLSP
jgi:hypothetical protein